MRLQTTRSFDRDYARLPNEIAERVDKQLVLLLANPRHPSLGLKKMRGTQDIWELRVTLGYRVTMTVEGETAILRRVGSHDVLREP